MGSASRKTAFGLGRRHFFLTASAVVRGEGIPGGAGYGYTGYTLARKHIEGTGDTVTQLCEHGRSRLWTTGSEASSEPSVEAWTH